MNFGAFEHILQMKDRDVLAKKVQLHGESLTSLLGLADPEFKAACIDAHVALHCAHYPEEKAIMVRPLLHSLFEAITEMALETPDIAAMWNAQHARFSDVVSHRNETFEEDLGHWFSKEHALCWARCLLSKNFL